MAAVASPYGLRPVQLLGGLPWSGGVRSYSLANNSATAFYFGSVVGLNASGDPVTITKSPVAAAADSDSPIGVFMGCEYEDPVRGFVNAQMFPANAITAGAKKVKFKILDNPFAVFMVQANGPVTADKIGKNVALATFATGNAATGDSTVAAAAAAAVTATFALKIIGFADRPGQSVAGDAFTDLLVIWNAQVHRYALGLSV